MTEKTAYEIQNELNQRIVNEFVLDKFTKSAVKPLPLGMGI